jgi:pSer/pThr/pTyr-binding forkhead associated (FHA) protein
MALFAQLTITEAGRPDRSIAVPDTATIGRDSDNDIVLEAITVSRYHALLLRDTAELLLLDLESTNGTLVNGLVARPDAPVRLVDGDVIRFGQVVACYRALNLPYQETHDEPNNDPETDDSRTISRRPYHRPAHPTA